MSSILNTHALAFTFIAPAAALLPVVMSPHTQALSQSDVAALHARFDPSLAELRGGRVDAPASFATSERAEFAAAQQQSTALPAMRAGAEPTQNEWTWLALGAIVVLLIILI